MHQGVNEVRLAQDGHGPRLAVSFLQPHLHIVLAAGGGCQVARQPGLHLLLGSGLGAKRSANGGSDRQIEDDHGGDGVAGQTEDWHAVAHGDDGRLAGADAQPMDEDAGLAEAGDHLDAEIAIADRAAGGKHDDVVLGVGLGRGRLKRVAVVGDDAVGDGRAAGAGHQRSQRIRVDVAHLSGRDRLIGRHDFISGGEDADARRDRDRDLGDAQRHQSADVLGAEKMARLQDGVAGADILAYLNDVLAHGDGAQRLDAGVVDALGVFHHDDAVGAGRDHAAGVHQRGLAHADL